MKHGAELNSVLSSLQIMSAASDKQGIPIELEITNRLVGNCLLDNSTMSHWQ